MSLDVTLVVGSQAVFAANITHNLGKMASEAGFYKQVWRPEELGIKRAWELVEPIGLLIQKLKEEPGHYKQFEASNGWGKVSQFIPWLEEYLAACKSHPNATIEISR